MDTLWDSLPLTLVEPVKRTIQDLDFKKMTPVQAACIPLLLTHKDVAAEAQRRTGLFSATQTSDVISLIRAGLRNPVKVKVKEKEATGQAPGEAYVERLPFNLHHKFNSTTIQGRANVAKATMALVMVASLGTYVVGPSVVKALSEGAAAATAATPKGEGQKDAAATQQL
ncbi:ATP-dependent RNA helicase DDX55 [Portunus trituberculatus]|uniref:ATP-dependent RNA helicase DDX55 n=1 Tax=Portunus trituberculatus TaxID=210409 RepID=A0A5B7DG65_PORTR|nr:ATP-dependent RNA helicase DDX55 [Portunus trituberculatus]